MSPTLALTVFALIVPAELPDKTMIATLVLSTRLPALPVLLGVAAAFAVQCGTAVVAGGLVSLLPEQPVHAVTAALFAAGAVLMLVTGGETVEEETEEVEEELARESALPSFRRAALTSFLILFAAEWGDLSQILTANFAAKYADPAAVFVGSWVGLVTVATLAVVSGRALLRIVPLAWVRRLAAGLFAAMAVVTALEAAKVL